VNDVIAARAVTLLRGGRRILDSVSLSLTPGRLTAIIGPNGSGKSTLLRALAGLWPVSSGRILVGDTSVESLSRREVARRIAFVPQDTRIDFAFTVEEIVSMGRYAHRRRFSPEGREDRAAVQAALERCDISHLASRPANGLSGGERQRVLIARSLAAVPKAILLDEPTASLDIEHALDILSLCRELAREGRCVVLATHDLSAVARHADSVALLDHGRLIAAGATGNVLDPESLAQVFGVRGEVVHTADGAPHFVFQTVKAGRRLA
jgi:iron complex transport system ATP-binding protein